MPKRFAVLYRMLNLPLLLLQAIFGQLQWTRPNWLNKLITYIKNHSRLGYFILILVSIIFVGGVLKYWYDQHPQPNLITATFASLEIPDPSDEAQSPPELFIQFGTTNAKTHELNPQSVIPLQATASQNFTSDKVEISPKISGEWQWVSDSSLKFMAKTAWISGQKYRFTFKPEFFAKQARFKTYQLDFLTPPLNPVITEFKLYQDPTNPIKLSLTATVQFNYPIDHDSFSNNVAITPQSAKGILSQKLPLTITYAKGDRIAYLNTNPITLPENPQFYILAINKNTYAINSNAPLAKIVSDKVLIPDASSMMKITDASTDIVRNENGNPEQIINIHTSLGLKTDTLKSVIHVYQLPNDYPATSIEATKTNYVWKTPGEVTSAILKSSQPITLTSIPAPHDHATLHSFKFHAEPGRFLFVTIDNTLRGDGGYRLKENYQTILAIPQYPQETRFLHQGALLALGSEHKLSVVIRGLDTIKYEIGRVLPQEINHLITQTSGDFDNPYFSDCGLTKNDLSEVFTQLEDVNGSDPAKPQYSAIDLDKYLKPNANNPKPLGLFLIKVQGWDRGSNSEIENTSSTRLILLTDMALIVKKNLDESRDVFISSITAGKPVDSAKVSILGRNGTILVSALSDSQGHVHFSALDIDKYKNEKEPVVIIATRQNDFSFIPYNKEEREINYSRFDTAGINDSTTGDNLSAFIFSDRGIYRPGETAHLGFIVKNAYAQEAQAGLPLEIVITDPQGNTVKDETISLPTNGYFTQDFATQDTIATGNYNIAVYIHKDEERGDFLGENNIIIQDFLPDTMKISAEFSESNENGWVSPTKLFAKIKLANLYGTPSAEHRVTGKIILNPHQFSFPQYKDYHFNTLSYDKNNPPRTITEELPDTTTDANGQAQFDLNLTRFDKATYELHFYTQGFAKDSGRSVSSEVSTLVSPLPYLVGYKVDGDYSFIHKNAKNSVNFIAINPQLKRITQNNLQIAVIEQNNVASLVEKENGTYEYKTITAEKTLNTQPFVIPETGIHYPLPTDKVGHFILAILAEDGTSLTRIPFNVVGNNETMIQKNTELTVSLNKKVYQPGEEVQLQISAPYTGSGLITIERDKIYAYKWFTASTSNSVQTLKIPAELIGNGYINVTYIRNWDSPEIYLNPLSYSVIPLTIDPSAHQINVALKVPPELRAGTDLPIEYQSKPASKIIIFAVDEGILRAGDYQTPTPLHYFFQKRSLEVTTQQIIDLILPKYLSNREISSVAGDASKKAMEVYLNPFKRKNMPPVAFWSGIINANEKTNILHFKIPDSFNGTLRVMAVAANNNQVGSAEQSTIAQNDFILSPTTPTFTAPGDTFDITLNITNTLKDSKALPIKVSINTSKNLEIIGNASQLVTLDKNQDTTVHFKLRALNQLGNAQIDFTAMNETLHKQSKQTNTLSIRPAMPYSTLLTSGYKKSGTVSLTLNNRLYNEKRLQTVIASNTPLIFITGLSQYLDLYPYGCTEQLVSQGFASLILREIISSNQPNNTISQQLKRLINAIQLRQNSDGSFSYWPGISNDNNLKMEQQFSSVYAMHLLTEAREHHEDIAAEVFSRGIEYLKQLSEENTTDLTMARIQAYAIYVLTRNEIVTTNYLTNLQSYLEQQYASTWKQDITSSYLAATYALLHDEKTANLYISGYQLGQQKKSNLVFYDPPSVDAQYIYLLGKHFPTRLSHLTHSILISLANNLSNNTVSTTTAAFDILALSTVSTNTPSSSNNPITLETYTADDKKAGQVLINSLQAIPLNNDISKIMLNSANNSGFFYQLSQSGFSNVMPSQAVSEGIEITHDYTDNQNKPLTVVKLGQEVTIHIKLRSLTHEAYSHIAIVDLLPGGFDMVANSTSGSYLYQEPREDRMLFFGYLPENTLVELTYRIKAVAQGDYSVPPAFAEDMYNSRIHAMSQAGHISIQ